MNDEYVWLLNSLLSTYVDKHTWWLKKKEESKASLRLRLFCMMKYMHQYKQKKKEKDENILALLQK